MKGAKMVADSIKKGRTKMSNQPFHRIDPEDFERTKEFLKAFIGYAGPVGLGLRPSELKMLEDVAMYLDIMSTKNWSIAED
jgi:hypothetical protein